MGHRKRHKTYQETAMEGIDQFDQLPDDLVVLIMSKLASSASCPADFLSVLSTCKRLNRLALHPIVLSKAGPKAVAIKAKNWSESAHRFLKQCTTAGSPEAAYTLGMIRFYCLQNRATGASLMAKAAIKSHIQALYSLAVIQFNGSGGSKNDKDLQAGVALTARAAFLGHIDALRELGHCLQDGYGVPRNVAEGRRLLVQANARELASFLRAMGWQPPQPQPQPQPQSQQQKRSSLYQYLRATVDAVASGIGCPLLSDFGCNVPSRAVHPVNQFLKEWFEPRYRDLLEKGLTLCSHSGCGRPETRPHEFRRCSVCGNVNYCSRGCQALDWKLRHKAECVPHEEQWLAAAVVDEDGMEGGIVGMEGLNRE